jgi:hypothetical protein
LEHKEKNMSVSVSKEPVINSGEWMDEGFPAIFSMGEFIQMMVDGGDTDFVIAAVKEVTDLCPSGHFRMKLDIELVPSCMIESRAKEIKCDLFTPAAIHLVRMYQSKAQGHDKTIEDYERWVETA